MGTGFQFCEMESGLEVDDADGCDNMKGLNTAELHR